MGTKTIMYDRIVPPGGEFRPRTRVRVRLVAADSGEGTGYNSTDQRTIIGVADELLTDSELFVIDLDATASISAPENAAYEITRVYPKSPAPPAETFTVPAEPTPTTTTQAVTLPAANVAASTLGFTSSGAIYLGGQLVTYTGTTPTAFTGCTGGSGPIPSGTAVRQAHWIPDHLVNPPAGLPALHIVAPSGAHGSTAISTPAVGSLVSTNVGAQLSELEATKLGVTGDQTATGKKWGNWFATAPKIDIIATQDPAIDTPMAQAALTAAAGGRPTMVNLVCHPDHSGSLVVNDTLVIGAGAMFDAAVLGSLGTGPRITWAGPAGGTIVRCNAQRSWLGHIRLLGGGLAATCVEFINGGERQGCEDIAVEDFTGTGVKLGNGVPNHNGFRSRGALYIRGLAGSVGMVLDAAATEDAHFETVNITRQSGEALPMLRGIDAVAGIATIDELLLDDNDMVEPGIREQAGSLYVHNITSELKRTWTRTNVGRGRGSGIGRGDIRAADVGAGEFALDISGSGAQVFDLGPVHINRKQGAANAPNVRVSGAGVVLVSQAIFTALDQAGIPTGEALGQLVTANGGHFVDLASSPIRASAGVEVPNAAKFRTKNAAGNDVDLIHLTAANHVIVGEDSPDIADLRFRAGTGVIVGSNAAGQTLFTADPAATPGQTGLTVRANRAGVVTNERVSVAPVPVVALYAANGNDVKPVGAYSLVMAKLIAPGGAGGSGRLGAAGSARGGGGAGAGGGQTVGQFPYSQVPASQPMTFGAAGVGGASVATNDTDGNNGTSGGNITWGSAGAGGLALRATGGNGGTRGTAAGGAGGTAGSGTASGGSGGAGGAGAVGVGGGAGAGGAAGGGGGGGVSSGDAAFAGGVGGTATTTGRPGGVAGAIAGNGASPTVGAAAGEGSVGSGGGGGGGATAGAAGNGAAGANYGGGGGGGGGGTNGGSSGAGGAGAPGIIVIVTA